MAQAREMSVLIIGKTGNGRSSLANTITGTNKFPTGCGMAQITKTTHAESVTVEGLRLKVIDTADFVSLEVDDPTTSSHVAEWKEVSGGSPDVIILTVRRDQRYTREEYAIYRQIVRRWGDNPIFRQRLMVAFTHGFGPDADLDQALTKDIGDLKSVLNDAQNRYMQVDNEAPKAEKKEQRKAICQMIRDIVIPPSERTARFVNMTHLDPAAVIED